MVMQVDMSVSDSQRRVLVIEDEPVFRSTLVAQLQAHGDLVFEAEDGTAGLAAVAMFHPDIVLCDLSMPGMDGHQVIECICCGFPAIPVIVVSGKANLEDVTRALRAGAKDYLIKPIQNWPALFDAMNECLSSLDEESAYSELVAHLSHFRRDDLAATQLLHSMAPPNQQKLLHWQASYQSSSPMLLPVFLELKEELLLVVMELSVLGANSAFIGAMVKFLLHAPYRQYMQGESRLLDSPGAVLEYLNWHLCESGLQGNINMAAILLSASDEQIRFANAGLASPSWLQHALGMPLGIMRQADYPTYRRYESKPFELQVKVDSGAEMSVQLALAS